MTRYVVVVAVLSAVGCVRMSRAEADDEAYTECRHKLSRYGEPAAEEMKACQERRSDEIMADDEADHARRADALRHMGDGFKQPAQPQPVNCTSNTYGTTTYTNCR